ncbi:MAG: hypothetical protein J1E60_06170 [Christensenellaceae bacterium]|nr:hypothetical protein [Christensenellaceae bacterium]
MKKSLSFLLISATVLAMLFAVGCAGTNEENNPTSPPQNTTEPTGTLVPSDTTMLTGTTEPMDTPMPTDTTEPQENPYAHGYASFEAIISNYFDWHYGRGKCPDYFACCYEKDDAIVVLLNRDYEEDLACRYFYDFVVESGFLGWQDRALEILYVPYSFNQRSDFINKTVLPAFEQKGISVASWWLGDYANNICIFVDFVNLADARELADELTAEYGHMIDIGCISQEFSNGWD